MSDSATSNSGGATSRDRLATGKRPNLLLILADQWRGDSLGIEGHPVVSTPNLDYLGATGAHFRRAYSECPSCVPARRTIFSGQAPAVHGMVGMKMGVPWAIGHTLAGELARAGYQTEMVGKLHLHPPRRLYGFHHLQLAEATQREENNDYLEWLKRGAADGTGGAGGAAPLEVGVAHGVSPNGWVGRPSHLPEHKTHSYWCVSQATEFLAKRDPTVPFFLNVSFIDPHPPLTPPQFYYDRYMALDLPEPVVGDWAPNVPPGKGQDPNAWFVNLDRETMRRCRAGYYGLMNHVDDQVARLLAFMRLRGLLDDTLVLFTSDHGEMLGDHHMFRKCFPYEGSARVPFLLRAPRWMGLRPGVALDQPVGLQDVMPTLLDAAGVEVPETVTGRSVLPLLQQGVVSDAPWRDALHGEHSGLYQHDLGMHFLVDGRAKYVWWSQTGREQLFDLAGDPNEVHDLAQGADAEQRLAPWRARLVRQLRERPEGFTAGGRLVPGRPHEQLVPAAPAIV
ncbi:MAG: Arylsulfatase [uncultured Chloroflexi bacterium]|uniref:Arylsulfatase n=1 Tax=uncultured Chloroflexota bacterium TaxID=166587 RepID=A0A6J4KHW9_9CHLR|nr:MAG: Arylsulfatase [uncultured Chloroflexota bacterium]